MTIEKRARIGFVAGLANFASITIQNLLLVPIFLTYWGKDRYGVWLSLLAGQAILQTISASYQGYVGNEINRAIHDQDRAGFSRLLGSSLAVSITIGLILSGGVLVFYWQGWLSAVLENAEDGASSACLWLTLLWCLVGPVQGVLIKIYAPLGFYARGMWWSVAQRIAQSIGLSIAVWGNLSLPHAALAYGGVSCLTGFLIFRDIYVLLKKDRLAHASVDLALGLRDFFRSLAIWIKDLIEQMGNNGLILVMGRRLGVGQLPMFTTLRTLANTAMQATSILLQPMATDLIRLHVTKRGRDIAEFFSIAWFVTGVLVNLTILVILPFAPAIYGLWVRGKIEFDQITLLFFMWSVVLKNFGAPFTMYLTNNNHLSFMAVTATARNAIILGLAVVMMDAGGVRAVALALAVAEIVASLALPLWYARVELRRIGGRLEKGAVYLALAEQAVWPLLILGTVISPERFRIFTGVSLCLVGALSWMRWRRLSERSLHRLKGVLKLA